jgi:hypothetical protein
MSTALSKIARATTALRRVAFVLLFTLAGIVSAQDVIVDSIPGTDFSRFRTYAWAIAPNPIQDVTIDGQIRPLFNNELATKGLSERGASERFDLIALYSGETFPDPKNPKLNHIRLQLALADAADHKVLWRGVATAVSANDVKHSQIVFQRLVHVLVEHYPPAIAPRPSGSSGSGMNLPSGRLSQ